MISNMINKKRLIVPAVLAAIAIAGCSSDGDDDGGSTTSGTTTAGTTTSGDTTAGTTTNGTTTAGTTTNGTTTSGSGDASFFNDDRGLDFASGLGSSVSRIFSSAFSSLPLLLGSINGDDAPRLARMTDNGTDSCSGGGSISYSFVSNVTTDQPESASLTFNNCIEGNALSSGGFLMTFAGDFNGDSGSVQIVFEEFTVNADGEVATIDGGAGLGVSTSGDTTTATMSGDSLTLTSTGGMDDGTVTFTDFGMTAITNDTTGDASVSGQAGISTPEGSLTMLMEPPFQIFGGADYPSIGAVNILASDGSYIQIDANTGNLLTYSYIINYQSTASSGIGNWEDSGIELETEF